jgi:hypothetical protein
MDYSENEENTDILSIAQLVFGGCFNDCIWVTERVLYPMATMNIVPLLLEPSKDTPGVRLSHWGGLRLYDRSLVACASRYTLSVRLAQADIPWVCVLRKPIYPEFASCASRYTLSVRPLWPLPHWLEVGSSCSLGLLGKTILNTIPFTCSLWSN